MFQFVTPVMRAAVLLSLAAAPISFSVPAMAATANKPPQIDGAPVTSIVAGATYRFAPRAWDLDHNWLQFSIQNKPDWATFDRATGVLTGVPKVADVTTYQNIVISVSDLKASDSLPPFNLTVSKPVPANSPPVVTGRPATAVVVGAAYSFTPAASDADHNSLVFSIQNQPVWAMFNKASGALTGIPQDGNVGTYASIVISVSDGKTSVALPAFSLVVNQIATGNLTVDWMPPTENADGSVLTNLAGYRMHYGTSRDKLTQTIDVKNPGLTSYVVEALTSGTWYFEMTSYNTAGMESVATGVVSSKVL